MRAFLLLMAAVLGLTSCGTPGPPLPPSLDVPQPVSDLAVERVGANIQVEFTAPDENTDHLAIKMLGEVTLEACTQPKTDCSDLHRWAANALHPGQRAQWSGALPPRPYLAVITGNDREHSAGPGTSVWVPLMPAAEQPAAITARVTPDAVVFSIEKRGTAPPSGAVLRLFRATAAQREPVQVAEEPLGAAEIEDKNFEWNQKYQYQIVTVNRTTAPDGSAVEFDSGPAQTLEVETKDVFPPSPPTGLAAVFAGTEVGKVSIDLSWNPNPERDVAGYVIYRGGSRLTPEIVKAPSYRDLSVVAGQEYSYQVSAVDLRGNESQRSTAVTERVPQQP